MFTITSAIFWWRRRGEKVIHAACVWIVLFGILPALFCNAKKAAFLTALLPGGTLYWTMTGVILLALILLNILYIHSIL